MFPARGSFYILKNSTTGNFTLTAITSAGGSTGVVLPQGGAPVLVFSDGTDISLVAPNVSAQLPSLFFAGLGTSNAADADHDITVAVGACADSTSATIMRLTAAITKRIDASWAAGTGNGGLFSGSVANTTWYHLFLIYDPINNLVDAGFDTSTTAANRPAAYTLYRYLGASVLTNGSANILPYIQDGDDIYWSAPPLDINGTLTSAAWTTISGVLSVPTGFRVRAFGTGQIGEAGTPTSCGLFALRATDATNSTPASDNGIALAGPVGSSADEVQFNWDCLTDITAKIAYYAAAADPRAYMRTGGWTYQRDKQP